MKKHHAGEWKGMWSAYDITPDDLTPNKEGLVILNHADAVARSRAISSLEFDADGSTMQYVDTDLGSVSSLCRAVLCCLRARSLR
eukprot:3545476-Rhodomonas_salina.1